MTQCGYCGQDHGGTCDDPYVSVEDARANGERAFACAAATAKFRGFDGTAPLRTTRDLTAPMQIGYSSWWDGENFIRDEYWVLPDGSAEVRESGAETLVFAPGSWSVGRDWPTHSCRGGEYLIGAACRH